MPAPPSQRSPYIVKLFVAIVLIALSPLLLPLFIVMAVLGIAIGVFDWLRTLWYCLVHSGELYLICSRRRGWQPFLVNNLIPVLPSQVQVIWLERPNEKHRFLRSLGHRRSACSVPILALVTLGGIKLTSLNKQLFDMKHLGKSSQATRERLRPIIETAMQGFLAQHMRDLTKTDNESHAL
jgi:hypothetical protein